MQYLGLAVEEFTSNEKEGNFSTITNACTVWWGVSEYQTNLINECQSLKNRLV